MRDLIRNLGMPLEDKMLFIKRLRELHVKIKNHPDRSTEYYIDLIESFLKRNPVVEDEDDPIVNVFNNGMDCNLLQPDGQGWQKGKLKICFEFIPEEPESIENQENPVETHNSPLDEIRNSIIESNEDRRLNNLELLHPFQSRGNS